MDYLTLESLLEQNLQRHPDKTALICQEQVISFRELEQFSRNLADFFLMRGLARGSRIGILGANSAAWVLSFLAASRMGAVSVMINPRLTDAELLEILEYSSLDGICFLTDKKPFPRIYQQTHPEVLIWNEKELWEAIKKSNICSVFAEYLKPRPEDILCMLFTSGSTASPKGVLLEQGAVIQVALETVRIMGWTGEDVFCLGLPLFHVFGLSAGLLSAVVAGAAVCLLENGHSLQLMEAAERYRCTVMSGVPTMFLAMLRNPSFGRYDLSALRSGVLAGAGITPAYYLEICDKLSFQNLSVSYGMTETSPSLTFSPAEDPVEKKAVSVGRPIPGVRISIRSEDGRELPAGENGEVCVKGFNVMKGYFRMEKATRAAFDVEGWFHTGDIGCLDSEGYLHITGRLKEIIIRSGEKLSPLEIETALLDYPAVLEAKVVGVSNPVTQEEVAACLVKKPGMELNLEELEDFLSRRLAFYKIPRYYLVFNRLPLNAAGKTDGKQLKAILLDKYQRGQLRQSVLQNILDGNNLI